MISTVTQQDHTFFMHVYVYVINLQITLNLILTGIIQYVSMIRCTAYKPQMSTCIWQQHVGFMFMPVFVSCSQVFWLHNSII